MEAIYREPSASGSMSAANGRYKRDPALTKIVRRTWYLLLGSFAWLFGLIRGHAMTKLLT